MQLDQQSCERVWRRVAPELDPYPEARAAALSVPAPAEAALPAPASAGPCCMEDTESGAEVLEGFLREALAAAQRYAQLACQAPSAEARRAMRSLAAAENAHVRTLQAARFLIRGEAYRVSVVLPPLPKLPWPDALRARWHEAACGGFNYARAARESADVCLRRVFEDLSREEYAAAERLRRLLERAL